MFSRCHFQKVPWKQLKHQRAAKPDQGLKTNRGASSNRCSQRRYEESLCRTQAPLNLTGHLHFHDPAEVRLWTFSYEVRCGRLAPVDPGQ